jgi:hypothetical protein
MVGAETDGRLVGVETDVVSESDIRRIWDRKTNTMTAATAPKKTPHICIL